MLQWAGRSWLVATTCLAVSLPAAAQETVSSRLSLAAAITEALEHSPALAPHVDTVTLAEIRQRVAASAFATKITPSVTTTADPIAGDLRSAGVTVAKNLTTGGQVFVNALAFSVGDAATAIRSAQYSVGFSQPLLQGFGRSATAGLMDADRARVTADRELRGARAALIVDVTRQYFAVVKAERVAAVAHAAASRATSLTAASKARTGVGLATQLDVLRSELQESHLAAAVAEAEGALAEAQDNLALNLGRPLGGPIAIETEIDLAALEADLAPVPATLEDLVGTALASRTEVIEARDKVTDAGRAADVARSNLLPPLTLDLGYTQRSLGVPGAGSIEPLTSGWHVGLGSTYSIDRAAGAAAVGTARVASGAAERAAMASARQIEADVRRTYRLWQAAIATVGIERGAVDLAERERTLAEMRLERGLGDTLDVVAAENNLLQAQTGLIGAELDRAVLAIDLRRAVGALDEERWP